jgi:hypothetical protein
MKVVLRYLDRKEVEVNTDELLRIQITTEDGSVINLSETWGQLSIMGERALCILPEASNHVRISTENFKKWAGVQEKK